MSRASAWTGQSAVELSISSWLLRQWWSSGSSNAENPQVVPMHCRDSHRGLPIPMRKRISWICWSLPVDLPQTHPHSHTHHHVHRWNPLDPSIDLQKYHRNYHCLLVAWFRELVQLEPIFPVSLLAPPAPRCTYSRGRSETHSVLCITCPWLHPRTDDPFSQHPHQTGLILKPVVQWQSKTSLTSATSIRLVICLDADAIDMDNS